jgi:hypothetical protein
MGIYARRHWKSLALFAALTIVAGATWLVLRPHPHPSAYQAIHNGMTLQQVHALLGPSETQYYLNLELPDGQPLANGGIGYEEWERLEATIQVFYDPRTGLVNNKSRTSRNAVMSIWTLLRERLGI